MGYEAVWRSSSSKLHLTRAEPQFLHDGNILSHLFFLLWHREHEARALAGAEDCAIDAAGPVPLSRAIGDKQSREEVTSVQEQGVLRRSAARLFLFLPHLLVAPSAGWKLSEVQNLEYWAMYPFIALPRLPPHPIRDYPPFIWGGSPIIPFQGPLLVDCDVSCLRTCYKQLAYSARDKNCTNHLDDQARNHVTPTMQGSIEKRRVYVSRLLIIPLRLVI